MQCNKSPFTQEKILEKILRLFQKKIETCLVMLVGKVKGKVQRDTLPFKEGENTRLLGQNTHSRQVLGYDSCPDNEEECSEGSPAAEAELERQKDHDTLQTQSMHRSGQRRREWRNEAFRS